MENLWITTKELAKIKQVSERAIRKAISKNKYIFKKEGKSYQILVNSLEDSLKAILIDSHYKESFCKISSEESLYSDKDKKLALAKYDLVQLWSDYKSKENKSKTSSADEFLIMYNRGLLHSDIYKIIREVSRGTIYRWNKKLKENNKNWQSLINNYIANFKNKSVLKPQEETTFLSLLLHQNQINIGKAIKLSKHILRERDFNSLASDITYRRFAEKYKKEHYDIWIFSREGSKALKDKVVPFIERDISKLEIGDVLIGDGHRLAFQVINPFDGKPCRPTIVVYQDWKSGAMVGFEIMLEENTQCIASALRNSIINLGKFPKYCYQDNGRASKSKYFTEFGLSGLFSNLGIQPIFARPYNAKAKTIERFFREMHDSFERLLPSFVGSSIDNKPAYLKKK